MKKKKMKIWTNCEKQFMFSQFKQEEFTLIKVISLITYIMSIYIYKSFYIIFNINIVSILV